MDSNYFHDSESSSVCMAYIQMTCGVCFSYGKGSCATSLTYWNDGSDWAVETAVRDGILCRFSNDNT